MGLFSFAESKKFLGRSSVSSKGPRFLDVHSSSSFLQFAFLLCIQLQLQPGSSLPCITGRRLQGPGISS